MTITYSRAAFQFGVKMSDGRKTRRTGPKDEKAKLDRDWNKISKVCFHRKLILVKSCGMKLEVVLHSLTCTLMLKYFGLLKESACNQGCTSQLDN